MSKTFCSLPWIHLSSMPTGHVPLCCNSDHTNLKDIARIFARPKDIQLNLNENTIDEIFNSDYFKQTRLEMLNDKVPDACKGCFIAEKSGIKSKRLESLEEFQLTEDNARLITDDTGCIKINFEYLEFRLGNACNLKCVTCNPGSSSLWIKEYEYLENNLSFVPKYNIKNSNNFRWHENDYFWKDLEKYADGVSSVYINGGEPLLGKKHVNFLKKLNSNCKIKYNTNGTIITDDILEAWSKFKRVEVNISIDDIYDRNSYIRYPTDWDQLIANTIYLKNVDFVNVCITQTISMYNIYYIKEFKDFFKNLKIPSHFNFLRLPNFLSSGYLPDDMVSAVLEKHKNENYIKDLKKYFNMSKDISNDEKENMILQFIKYTSTLDNLRNTDFSNSFNEWNRIINETKK